jgi:Hypothetical glycosyl hydrolase family 15
MSTEMPPLERGAIVVGSHLLAAQRFGRKATVASVGLICAATMSPAAGANAQVVLPTASGIHRFTGLQGHIGHRFTAAELSAIGHQSDIVNGLAVQIRSYGAALKKANPRIRLFVYVNGMFAQSNQANAFPPSWYLHDGNGNKITSGTNHNYLMNPFSRALFQGHSGWAAFVAYQCAAKINESRFGYGCFLDQMSSAGNTAFVSAHPINPQTHLPFTMSAFMNAVNVVGNRVARIAPIVGNSYESGARYYGNQTRIVNASNIHLFEAEHWLGATQPRDAHNLVTWKQNVQMLIDAQRHGKGALLNFGEMASSLQQWQNYVVSSMLLGNNGRVWIHFDSSNPSGPTSWQLNTPLMRMPIGKPLQTSRTVAGYLNQGVYRRAFSNGLVIVNPTARSVSISLMRARRSPSGQLVSRVVLKPFTGSVLLG